MVTAEMRPRPRAVQGDGFDAETCVGSLGALVFVLLFVLGLIWALRRGQDDRKRNEAARAAEAQIRWESLCRRFGREAATRILAGEIWVGQTREMLVEAMGPPVDFDEKVMHTKTRHVLKWRRLGRDRYGLRVTLDDGIVVGWEM